MQISRMQTTVPGSEEVIRIGFECSSPETYAPIFHDYTLEELMNEISVQGSIDAVYNIELARFVNNVEAVNLLIKKDVEAEEKSAMTSEELVQHNIALKSSVLDAIGALPDQITISNEDLSSVLG